MKDFIHDIRAGLTDAAIMTKYNLSFQGLENALRKLLEDGVISRAEIDWRPTEYYDSVILENVREFDRIDVRFHLPIVDQDDPRIQGAVADISRGGVKVEGIDSRVNDTRRFIILADQLVRVDPITFEAQCRWSRKEKDGACFAGFKIISISDGCLEDLNVLIRAFSSDG
jgi:hypothetical protein